MYNNKRMIRPAILASHVNTFLLRIKNSTKKRNVNSQKDNSMQPRTGYIHRLILIIMAALQLAGLPSCRREPEDELRRTYERILRDQDKEACKIIYGNLADMKIRHRVRPFYYQDRFAHYIGSPVTNRESYIRWQHLRKIEESKGKDIETELRYVTNRSKLLKDLDNRDSHWYERFRLLLQMIPHHIKLCADKNDDGSCFSDDIPLYIYSGDVKVDIDTMRTLLERVEWEWYCIVGQSIDIEPLLKNYPSEGMNISDLHDRLYAQHGDRATILICLMRGHEYIFGEKNKAMLKDHLRKHPNDSLALFVYAVYLWWDDALLYLNPNFEEWKESVRIFESLKETPPHEDVSYYLDILKRFK